MFSRRRDAGDSVEGCISDSRKGKSDSGLTCSCDFPVDSGFKEREEFIGRVV